MMSPGRKLRGRSPDGSKGVSEILRKTGKVSISETFYFIYRKWLGNKKAPESGASKLP
jgi:hypothetical protein